MKNVLLLFLSPFQAIEKDGKILINETLYKNIEGKPTKGTNESAIRWLLQNEFLIDRIFILASATVRKNSIMTRDKKLYLDEKGSSLTHFDYFKNHMKKFLPNFENLIPENSIYNYDENSSGSQNLMSVAKIAGRIQDYAAKIKEETGEDVTLHVDLTGGMRQVNMMMLDIIRLIEYSGIKIGSLLYSNYQTKLVEEVNNIYDLFQLISGVEEFVRFGSVKALGDYYKKHTSEISPALNRLIKAMENFSEEIKLCHYGQFRNAIIELHDAIHDFKAESDNLQDLLMLRLINRIRKDYSSLIAIRDLDDLKVIRWCIDNGYMQQALTLYTERIPEYLGEHNFIKQSENESKQLDKHIANDGLNRNRWFYLLNQYSPQVNHSKFDKSFRIYCSEIKDGAVVKIRKKKFDFDSWLENLNNKLRLNEVACEDENLLREQLLLLQKLQSDVTPLSSLDNEELKPIRNIINKLHSELETIDKMYLRLKRIFDFIQKELKNESVAEYFPNLHLSSALVDKYPRAFKFHEMINAKIFSVEMNEETFLSIMDKYFKLKNERNHSNHARNDVGEFKTAEELKNFMEIGLNELEDVINEKYIC